MGVVGCAAAAVAVAVAAAVAGDAVAAGGAVVGWVEMGQRTLTDLGARPSRHHRLWQAASARGNAEG